MRTETQKRITQVTYWERARSVQGACRERARSVQGADIRPEWNAGKRSYVKDIILFKRCSDSVIINNWHIINHNLVFTYSGWASLPN